MSEPRRPVADDDDDAAARIVAMLKIGAPLAVILLAIGVGIVRGAPLAILVLAAGALATVIALFWQSVRTLVGETPLSGADAFAIAAPRAEEEKKRAVLRALKDLEFERSVGKISSADYDQLVLSYRAEARSLLQQIDEGAKPRRDRVMALVDERLRRAGLGGEMGEVRARVVIADSQPVADEEPSERTAAREEAAEVASKAENETEGASEDDADDERSAEGETRGAEESPVEGEIADEAAAKEPDVRPTCEACSTSNEPDAAFCKKCGAKMKGEVAADA